MSSNISDFEKLFNYLSNEFPFYDGEQLVEEFGSDIDFYMDFVCGVKPEELTQEDKNDLYIGFGQLIDSIYGRDFN